MKATKEYAENIEDTLKEVIDAIKVLEDKLKDADNALSVLCEKVLKIPKITDEMKKGNETKPQSIEAQAPTTTLKLEDVRKVLAEISRNGKTAEIKELLHKYGAEKLSSIKESDYDSLLKEAKEL